VPVGFDDVEASRAFVGFRVSDYVHMTSSWDVVVREFCNAYQGFSRYVPFDGAEGVLGPLVASRETFTQGWALLTGMVHWGRGTVGIVRVECLVQWIYYQNLNREGESSCSPSSSIFPQRSRFPLSSERRSTRW
jgi:hypothetical protein